MVIYRPSSGFLGINDPVLRLHAADTLGNLENKAIPFLFDALHSASGMVKIGAITALSAIRDLPTLEPLIRILQKDPVTEVRLAASLALGEAGSPEVIPVLVQVLNDENRYIRYGSADGLVKLGWQPETDAERICQLIAFQDWESVQKYGAAATRPLMDIFRDCNPATRSAIVSILGEIEDNHSQTACPTALKDWDPTVRWKAVLVSMNCGVSSSRLPLMLAARDRTSPNPYAAAILNFLFLGIDYNYLERWWGFLVFMTYMSVIVLSQLATGPFLPYLIAYPITAVLAVHTFYLARRMANYS